MQKNFDCPNLWRRPKIGWGCEAQLNLHTYGPRHYISSTRGQGQFHKPQIFSSKAILTDDFIGLLLIQFMPHQLSPHGASTSKRKNVKNCGMKQLKYTAWILSWMALGAILGCSSLPEKHHQSTAPEVKPQSGYTVVNLGPNFENFWNQAKTKSFEEQLVIWNETVERPYQAFYDGMVWQKKDNPKWEERKIRRLKEFFPKYQMLFADMRTEFGQFDSTLKKQIGRFTEFFPDAHFDLPIYAAPTTTFNGKGGEGGDSGDPLGKTVLAFGIDMMVDRKDNPDVLYSHELFHIYHTAAVGVNEQVFMNEGNLTLPLWLEGLATFVSQQMNPKALLADVLMDKDLPKLSKKQIQDLANMFLTEANEKAFDTAKPGIYKKWFAIDPQFNLRPNLPQRCGYLLGLKVSEHLSKKNKLQEMVH